MFGASKLALAQGWSVKACFDRRSKLIITISLVKSSFDVPVTLLKASFDAPVILENKQYLRPNVISVNKVNVMTDEELKALVASLAVAQQDTDRQLDKMIQENDRRSKETELKMQETDLQMKETAQRFKETAQRFKETAQRFKETDQRFKETDQVINKTSQEIVELGKQIGGLGKKFGSFTEGLALPSMTKILSERFGMEVISPSVRVKKQGENMEIDVLAYANSEVNEAYVVEVKSHVREEAINQLRSILERFRRFFPEHKDKAVYGILAAVDLSEELRERILKAGFYVARIHDEVFELDVPANFKPKAY